MTFRDVREGMNNDGGFQRARLHVNDTYVNANGKEMRKKKF